MKIEYFQTMRKRDFAQILENFLTAGHLVFSRPFTAAKQTIMWKAKSLVVKLHSNLPEIKASTTKKLLSFQLKRR